MLTNGEKNKSSKQFNKSGKNWSLALLSTMAVVPLVFFNSQSVLAAEEVKQVDNTTLTIDSTSIAQDETNLKDDTDDSQITTESSQIIESTEQPDTQDEATTVSDDDETSLSNSDETEKILNTNEENDTVTTDKTSLEVNNNTQKEKDSLDAQPTEKDSKQFEHLEKDNLNETTHFKPQDKNIKLHNILDWEPTDDVYDKIAKGSVELNQRTQGHQTNPLASLEAKIQSLAYLSSKAKGHSSVGGGDQGMGVYAFDYWQYLDSMVFWDGLIPNPDVIDAAHRNGVPIYGTLFYNWSSSLEDRNIVDYTLQEDTTGSNTFPVARKLVDMASYYGFDGFFINQETSMPSYHHYSEKFKTFMNYAKEYAKEKELNLKFAWYDAMSNNGSRYHGDGVNDNNNYFLKKDGDKVAVDDFFMNFNWNSSKVTETVKQMIDMGRNPFDAFAGLELQRGGAYKTQFNRYAIIDSDGKPRLSLGLFVPDSIMGFAKDGVDFHKHENIFWTGHGGDPTKADDSHDWSAISRYVVEKTPILSPNFNTFFNTGHGKKWFINGKVSKDAEWNSRSVQDIMPTWRWWINNTKSSITANYDFDKAFNGGTSLSFQGNLEEKGKSEVMLYATNMEIDAKTVLRVTSAANNSVKLRIGLSTTKDYQEDSFKYYDIQTGTNWLTDTIKLADLVGQRVYGIKLVLESEQKISDYKLNLGQLSIAKDEIQLSAPKDIKTERKLLHNAQNAEAIISYEKVDGANYYEVYQEINGEWELVNATSSHIAYLPLLKRTIESPGKTQKLKVIAVASNGQRSQAGLYDFDWQMTVSDSTLPAEKAPNVVLGAEVTSEIDASNSESAKNILNGTINNTADKWYSGRYRDHVDIKLTKPRNVIRWVVEHAGAGGESVDDGLMNTKAFDLQYKDMETGEWKVAKEIKNNIAHVTDVVLDKPIYAQEWRLNVTERDNGTPWGGIRIYNWKMYEFVDTESENIAMANSKATHVSGNSYAVSFVNGQPNSTVNIYSDAKATQLIGQGTISTNGSLIITNVELSNPEGLIYYRTQVEGKELSNILAIPYLNAQQTIQKVELDAHKDMKLHYKIGETLDLSKGQIKLTLEKNGKTSIEYVSLTNLLVAVKEFNPNHIGEQKLSVLFNGQELDEKLIVTVSDTDNHPKVLTGIKADQLTKTNFQKGAELDLKGSTFILQYEGNLTETIAFNDEMEVIGYNPMKTGVQELTVRYKGLETKIAINVEELNYQTLDQYTAVGRQLVSDPKFDTLPAQVKEEFITLLNSGDKIKEDESLLQKDIDQYAQLIAENNIKISQLLEEINTKPIKPHDPNKPKEDADKPKEDSNKPKEDADKPKEDSNKPKEDADKPKEDSNKPKEDSNKPKEDSNKPKEDADKPKEDSNKPKEDADKPKEDSNKPKEDADKPKEDSDKSKEEPKIMDVLVDEATGVEVKLGANDATKGLSLHVKKVSELATNPNHLDLSNADVYEIYLVDKNGQRTQLTEPAIVFIPIAKGRKVEKIYYIATTGMLEELPLIDIVNNKARFEVLHFSYYGLLYQASKGMETPNQPKEEKELPKVSEQSGTVQKDKLTENKDVKSDNIKQKPGSQSSISSEKDSTTKSLPNTGEKDLSLVFGAAAMTILAGLGLVTSKKNRDYSDEH